MAWLIFTEKMQSAFFFWADGVERGDGGVEGVPEGKS